MIGETLRGLLRQTHPRSQILVTLCHDDQETIEAVHDVVAGTGTEGPISSAARIRALP